ncbi:MAG: endolytic transglycosylase MltG [Bacilli bacterium]
MKKVVIGISAAILIFIGAFVILFMIETTAVSRDKEIIEFEIKKGDTYLSLASSLKESNLIKSELFYKIYIKLMNPKSVQAGIYNLSESMSVSDIIKKFGKGNNYNPSIVKFTIPEGKHLENVAEIIANKTDHKKDELLELWDSFDFIDELIGKYWFITDDVKKKGIRHPLEGYFFPDTYELLNKSIDGKTIAYKMLDKMDKVLSVYKKEIKNNEYSIHQLLSLASIVEHEAILDEDRSVIAGVFYNRLNIKMKLESCATIGYAIDEWKLTYSKKDLMVDSPYNTYLYAGIPIGPGNMPGAKSIEAVINPAKSDYLFFLANVCDKENKKTYFSKTYAEHIEKKKLYLTCFN